MCQIFLLLDIFKYKGPAVVLDSLISEVAFKIGQYRPAICLYCGTPRTKLLEHLKKVHSTEAAVMDLDEIFDKNDKQAAMSLLRNKGESLYLL
jgi:hypothetical protein